MTDDELDRTYEDAWSNFYTLEHMITVLRRARALGSDLKLTTAERLVAFGVITRLYNLRSYDMGLIRSKSRKRRRPGFPKEPAWRFYPRHWFESAYNLITALFWRQRLFSIAKRLWADPKTLEYKDIAITPPEHEELDSLDLYQVTRGSEKAVELAKHRKRAKDYQAAVKDVSTGA